MYHYHDLQYSTFYRLQKNSEYVGLYTGLQVRDVVLADLKSMYQFTKGRSNEVYEALLDTQYTIEILKSCNSIIQDEPKTETYTARELLSNMCHFFDKILDNISKNNLLRHLQKVYFTHTCNSNKEVSCKNIELKQELKNKTNELANANSKVDELKKIACDAVERYEKLDKLSKNIYDDSSVTEEETNSESVGPVSEVSSVSSKDTIRTVQLTFDNGDEADRIFESDLGIYKKLKKDFPNIQKRLKEEGKEVYSSIQKYAPPLFKDKFSVFSFMDKNNYLDHKDHRKIFNEILNVVYHESIPNGDYDEYIDEYLDSEDVQISARDILKESNWEKFGVFEDDVNEEDSN